MNAAQRTDEPFLAELTVIQLHKVHHATKDRCTERIRLTLPCGDDQPQGFAVDFFAHLVVQLESGAHTADAVVAQLQAVIVERQTNPVGGCEKCFGRCIAAHDLGAQLDASSKRCGVTVLFSKEQGFLLHRQAGVDLTENRQVFAAVTEDAPLDSVLTVHHIILTVAETDLRFVRNIFVEVRSNHFHPFALYAPLIKFTGINQHLAVKHQHRAVAPGGEKPDPAKAEKPEKQSEAPKKAEEKPKEPEQPKRRGRPPKADKDKAAAPKPKAPAQKPEKAVKKEPEKKTAPTVQTSPAPKESEKPQDAPRRGKEQIVYIKLNELHAFKNHPFEVRDDEEMRAMVSSVKDKGVTQPAIVRPREDGGYEIGSGHRRQKASELAGYADMPCIVRNLTDDEAITQMVEDNLNQREEILPSERAKALKMQLEAIKHQGSRTSGQIDPKDAGKRSNEIVAERNKMAVKQVQRYIRLNELVPDLMKLMDEKKLGFTTAVELSYIGKKNQNYIAVAIDSQQSSPSQAQAKRKVKEPKERRKGRELER